MQYAIRQRLDSRHINDRGIEQTHSHWTYLAQCWNRDDANEMAEALNGCASNYKEYGTTFYRVFDVVGIVFDGKGKRTYLPLEALDDIACEYAARQSTFEREAAE